MAPEVAAAVNAVSAAAFSARPLVEAARGLRPVPALARRVIARTRALAGELERRAGDGAVTVEPADLVTRAGDAQPKAGSDERKTTYWLTRTEDALAMLAASMAPLPRPSIARQGAASS